MIDLPEPPDIARLPTLGCCKVLGPGIGVRSFSEVFPAGYGPAWELQDDLPPFWSREVRQHRVTRDRYLTQALVATIVFADNVHGSSHPDFACSSNGVKYFGSARLEVTVKGAVTDADYFPQPLGYLPSQYSLAEFSAFPQWLPTTSLGLNQNQEELFGVHSSSPSPFGGFEGFLSTPSPVTMDHFQHGPCAMWNVGFSRQELVNIDGGGLSNTACRQVLLFFPPLCSQPVEDLIVTITVMRAPDPGLFVNPQDPLVGKPGIGAVANLIVAFSTFADEEP